MTEPQQPAAPLGVDDPEPARRSEPDARSAPGARTLNVRPEPRSRPLRRSTRRCRSSRTHPRRPKKSQLTTRRRREDPNRWSRLHWTTMRPRLAEESVLQTRAGGGRGPAEPRSAGHFVAEALRAAGVRHAFTVPRKLPRRPRGARRRGDPRRGNPARGRGRVHGRGHGRLTGRPAACLDARVGAANRRSGSTRITGLDTDVRDRRPGRRATIAAARRSRRSTRPSHSGGLPWSAEPTSVEELACAPGSRPAGPRRRPGPVLLSIPEDLLDETVPGETRLELSRPPTARPTDEDVRAVLHLLTKMPSDR